jgi:hypothetical protein
MLLALAPLAHGLDAARVAPALEARFSPTATYLDCPFQHDARTCVLVPRASSVRSAYDPVLAFVRALPGVASLDRQRAPSSISFVVGDTAYRLDLARSRARPGAIAATLTFAFDRQSAFNVACHRTETLFDDARLASLSPAGYAAMATAVACHGADPVDARSRTPLVMAVGSGNLEAVRVLLRGGADPNHITQHGWTPLLFAARDGTPAVVEALLRAGADPSYIAPDGTTIGTLEPFNARLSTAAGPFAVAGPAAWVPVPLADPGARLATAPGAVADAGATGTRPVGTNAPTPSAPTPTPTAQPTASGPSSSPPVPAPTAPRPAVTVTDTAAAAATDTATDTATSAATAAATAAGANAATAPSTGAGGGFSQVALVAVEVLALIAFAALAIVRFRRHEPGPHPDTEPVPVTLTQVDLPAMPVPSPFRRQRSHRRLEPDPGADDRAY